MGFKVVKTAGGKDVLDSTHTSLPPARRRQAQLRRGLRGSKTVVSVLPLGAGDPPPGHRRVREERFGRGRWPPKPEPRSK